MYFCKKCETNKPIDEMKVGSRTVCKKCNSKDKVIYWANLSKHEKRDRSARRYGITKDIFDKMFSDQKGKCKICKVDLIIPEAKTRPRNRACVDHSHKTGKVRGLLCSTCNSAIGFLNDDIDTIYSAANYLEEYGE